MSEILIAGAEEEEKGEELAYEATEEDEEKFFLVYHMHLQPSEADNMSQERRRWFIARFVAQKNMEREAIQQQRIAQQIMPNLTGNNGGSLRI